MSTTRHRGVISTGLRRCGARRGRRRRDARRQGDVRWLLALASPGTEVRVASVPDRVCPVLCGFLREYAAGLDPHRRVDLAPLALATLGAPSGPSAQRARLARCRTALLALRPGGASRGDRVFTALLGRHAAPACAAALRLAGDHAVALAFAGRLVELPTPTEQPACELRARRPAAPAPRRSAVRGVRLLRASSGAAGVRARRRDAS